MHERLNKIGELLAKGVYLYTKKEKEAQLAKEQKKDDANRLSELSSAENEENEKIK